MSDLRPPAPRRDRVRAVLGRLFGRARSHRLAFAVGPSRPQDRDALVFAVAARESELVFVAPSYRWSVPCADAGGSGGNLAHIAANVAGIELALSTLVLELTLPVPQGVAVTPTDWPVASPTAAVLLPSPHRRGNGGCCKSAPLGFSRLQARSVGILSPRSGGARDGIAWFTQHIPLLRERLPAEEGEGQSAARARLAAASGADEEDVQVAGVYPRVPVTLVRQMVLTEGGRYLRLWLNVPRVRKPVRLWTVTLGRVRSSGRTVQTIAED